MDAQGSRLGGPSLEVASTLRGHEAALQVLPCQSSVQVGTWKAGGLKL